MGNAAFHSSVCYGSMAESVFTLQKALEDSDEKTRCNAAGALGNLVRHSGRLAISLADAHIPQLLMRMTLYDSEPAPKVLF